ncbi:FkbM family methyltransferase [Roseomonas marmotae]|uniref:FkbM family methyltransferase n=1 Tax=Roseomonas marmotae TaxID=2768161 RepID=A0ABS3KF18_9PROT|nr:FkbM family methyltransferase [Roseomonas marmotae]MBO1076064.1 FkbM family methyltransferase [Roseomonas marmotae]QTI81303.1 FkbM family methyltransferase [Roseomonas marmotae]
MARNLAVSRTGRYWLSKLSNHPDLEPLANAMENRVEAGLRRVQRFGYAPDLVVDIGAYRGDWTRMALPLFPGAQFVMLEAQPEKAEVLHQAAALAPGRVEVVSGLLGSRRAESVPFFLAETGSSLYAENTAFARQEVTLPMRTLDEALASHVQRKNVFLKLDVQGAELDVLAGAKTVLDRTELILLEVSLVDYNAGAPRMAEIVAHLHQLGFLPFDILDLRRIGTVLAQTDILFARTGSPIERRASAVIAEYGSS